ncbi:MAG: hypothetical protein N2491_00105 [Negativicutes bacterium]|nr:hypothetical protein [Negativicutes bacterium]
MFKLRIAAILSIIAAVLTMLVSVFNDVRFFVLLERGAASAALFGICGYIAGTIVDRTAKQSSVNLNDKGRTIDIVTTDENPTSVLPKAFNPFSPDDFDQVSPRNNQ